MFRSRLDGRRPAISGARLTATLLVAAACLSVGDVVAQDGKDESEQRLRTARGTMERYYQTRKLISQERLDWKEGKESLEDRIELVRGEVSSLREKIDETAEQITKADRKRQELIAENEALKEAAASLRDRIVTLEQRARLLVPRLPPPIAEIIRPLAERIPEDPDATEMSLGARYANVAGILDQVNKFNTEITSSSEIRDLDDGSSVTVTALYIGISYGFFVSADGEAAGVGTVTEDGWKWTEKNDEAARESIARAIAILKGEEIADFVSLPVTIH